MGPGVPKRPWISTCTLGLELASQQSGPSKRPSWPELVRGGFLSLAALTRRQCSWRTSKPRPLAPEGWSQRSLTLR